VRYFFDFSIWSRYTIVLSIFKMYFVLKNILLRPEAQFGKNFLQPAKGPEDGGQTWIAVKLMERDGWFSSKTRSEDSIFSGKIIGSRQQRQRSEMSTLSKKCPTLGEGPSVHTLCTLAPIRKSWFFFHFRKPSFRFRHKVKKTSEDTSGGGEGRRQLALRVFLEYGSPSVRKYHKKASNLPLGQGQAPPHWTPKSENFEKKSGIFSQTDRQTDRDLDRVHLLCLVLSSPEVKTFPLNFWKADTEDGRSLLCP
jgi:hypothetical protein